MKIPASEISFGRNAPNNAFKKLLFLAVTLIFLTIIPLCLLRNSPKPLLSPRISIFRSIEVVKKCDVYSGNWVPYSKGPYYTDKTCSLIIDQQNCMKFGRPDTEFMKWRWKPDECKLPSFNALQFLELVKGKSMAFVGDSVGKNQMQSLMCLLASVAYPEDVTGRYKSDVKHVQRWFYRHYKFTVVSFWTPFLVKSGDADPSGHSLNSLMNLYLNQPDDIWASEIENFDYVIISAGQWFFRPLIYNINGQVVGCHSCNKKNITAVTKFYGFRMAFRTAFKTLQNLKKYKGTTFLRTFSPSHFENGAWNAGGSCRRTRPFTSEEMRLDGYNLEFYLTQVEELKKAEKESKKRGLNFRLLAITEAMILRPDGHPNHFGHPFYRNLSLADCVHWCTPGPVDTWNEFLLYELMNEALGSRLLKLQNNV